MNTKQFPYQVRVLNEKNWFIPTMIDYMDRQVWHQRSQVSEDGEWINFNDVEFRRNYDFQDIVQDSIPIEYLKKWGNELINHIIEKYKNEN